MITRPVASRHEQGRLGRDNCLGFLGEGIFGVAMRREQRQDLLDPRGPEECRQPIPRNLVMRWQLHHRFHSVQDSRDMHGDMCPNGRQRTARQHEAQCK